MADGQGGMITYSDSILLRLKNVGEIQPTARRVFCESPPSELANPVSREAARDLKEGSISN